MRYAAPRWATKRDPSRPTDGGLVAAASLLYAGGPLMGWQREVADVALERDPETGRYVYDSITLIVGRRAGKTRLTHGVPLTRGLLGPVALTRPNGSLARVPFPAGGRGRTRGAGARAYKGRGQGGKVGGDRAARRFSGTGALRAGRARADAPSAPSRLLGKLVHACKRQTGRTGARTTNPFRHDNHGFAYTRLPGS